MLSRCHLAKPDWKTEKGKYRMKSELPVPVTTAKTERFPEKHLRAFYQRSNSAETRRAYARVAREFFQFCQWRQPAEITSDLIRDWRDRLKAAKQKPATVRQKLAIL